jgi:hypothetical protein
MLAVARAFANNKIAAREDPVEVGEMVDDRFDCPTYIGEELADLFSTRSYSPFWKVDLRIDGEQVENAAAV